MATVSIITPVYNGERYLPETIDSVIGQTYTDWEMIIVDDGSSDGSLALAEKYAAEDERIKVLSQANGGSAAARNHGIRKATGRYIALLDADDLWEKDFLDRQLDLMKKKGCICVYSSYKMIDDEGNFTGKVVKAPVKITYENMCIMNYIGCLTGLYDTQKYGKIYLREELKSLRDDYAYWLDIVRLENVAYGNPRPLARYRVLSSSTTGNKLKLLKVQYRFYRDYLNLSVPVSVRNLMIWGISGVMKFFV